MRCPYCDFHVLPSGGAPLTMLKHNQETHDGKTELPDYGELYTVSDFVEVVLCGGFVDDDGVGYYSDGSYMYHEKVAQPSVIFRAGGQADPNYSHVIWFNK